MRERRPRDLTPAETGFVAAKPVRWLNPGLLAGSATRVLLAHLFGGYLDKRELQAVLPGGIHDHSDHDELWLDYTADLGDGFDATYSIAYLLAQPLLNVDGVGELPRGELLVLGGDQVYPTASVTDYENRWKGPYRAALPAAAVGRSESLALYAVPGNHDWYDGLTAFLRLFAQGDSVGGWRTRQTRSYFALQLPHRWWLLAIDVQLTSYIDEPQLDYFHEVASKLGPDDRVILCSARPAWVKTDEEPDAYDNIDYFVRTVIEPTGASIPLMLAGDLHHYSRYSEQRTDDATTAARQLITCGGGGAYLVGTAHLPKTTAAPPESTIKRHASPSRTYELAAAYPSQSTSRRLGWQIFTRLPWRNPGFVGLTGLIQTLLMLALHGSGEHWVTGRVAAAVALVFAGTLLFATLLGARRRRHWIAGFIHGLPHVGLGIAGEAAWSALPFADAPGPWNTLLAFALYLPVAGLVDTWIVGIYLLLARHLNINVNELYAGLGIEDFKSFVRMRIASDGSLTIYPIAVERASHRWRADPDAPPDAPWIVPARPLRAQAAEPPVTLPG